MPRADGRAILQQDSQQALNQALLQHSCNNFAASPVASLAATMQQSCSNYVEAWARAGGRATLQQALNQAFLQHSHNNLAASLAAFFQQPCSNLATIILKRGRGRAGNLAASLESSTLATLMQQSCSNPGARPAASFAALLQQSCSNLLRHRLHGGLPHIYMVV